MTKETPDLSFEAAAAQNGKCRVVGVDEVGRGPWAGPVTAAAVWLNPNDLPDGMNDSKKLTAKRREALFDAIMDKAEVSIAHASVQEIDELNILQATYLAMRRAIAGLTQSPDHALIDGNRLPADLPCSAETVVKGDARSLSIAAASIVAKVTRDRIMAELAAEHPGYGWESNAGYGTKMHQNGLREFGVTPHHRRSFKPIHNILYQEHSVSD
ncbi:ribonuclease HII [Actibacterium pelagium]|uniref:Ribonuclease HII n=1 Tax=Actibacterium pelagium TaxID=2029103 RepID=A0A917AJ17_9RHOB|nr:ribonuclease HII [Actibacterium pelagium]GGE54890.1 ribonuclease HII [Actibacterium pelagium]